MKYKKPIIPDEATPVQAELMDKYTRITTLTLASGELVYCTCLVVGQQSFWITQLPEETPMAASWSCWKLAKAIEKILDKVLGLIYERGLDIIHAAVLEKSKSKVGAPYSTYDHYPNSSKDSSLDAGALLEAAEGDKGLFSNREKGERIGTIHYGGKGKIPDNIGDDLEENEEV